MSSSEREGRGYRFYHQTGTQARLSNSCRTAERHLARVEFQNGVVMSSGALEEGRPFQVLIESKVSTWSGSIIIGATTTPPERFSFPANLPCLTSDCWVVNGRSLWKNGYRKLPNYVPQALEALAEGSLVGVVRRGQSLHFLVNGADLGAAEEALPPGTKVWALVDLYGQCSRVSVVDCENRHSTSSTTTPLLFHSRCGDHAQILDGGTVAGRKSPESDFNHSVVLSNRPLISGELFEVEISAMQEKWSGSIELGVTTHNPEEFEFPATMSDVTSGTWIMSRCSIMCNGSTTIQDYYTESLDALEIGDRVGVKRLSNGSLIFCINGVEQGVAATNLPDQLYAVVDIYGQCSQVKLTTATQGAVRPSPPQGTSISTPERRREPLRASQEQPPSRDDDCLRFNTHCGENVELQDGGQVASRKNPYDEFTGATVLTSRPLRPGEMFELKISVVIDNWSGSLQMGVCQVDPEVIDFEDMEEMTDLVGLPYWILSGSDLHCEDSAPESDYPLNLDDVPEGSKIGLKVTLDGDLHFFINGVDMGVAAAGLPTEGLYGCAEIYGTCAQVSIVDHHDNVAQVNAIIRESAPVISLANRVTSTASAENHHEENMSVSDPPGRNQFHHVHGLNVSLSPDRTVAKRFQGFDQGLLFSQLPLQPGDAFEVELTELSSRAWQGSLRVGLVAKLPKSLPSGITELSEGSWALVGSSLIQNGSTVKQNFNAKQLHKIGSRLAVWYEIDGWMHVAVDGVDIAPLLPITAKLPYVVVDLYGGAKSVRIIPLDEAMQGSGAPSSGEARMHWSSECGSNVQLSGDYRSAKRTKSYSNGILISSSPLPNDRLFQCTVKELNSKWEGTLSLGVTSQFPRQACLVEKAQELKKRSYILCTEAGAMCLYIGGKEVCKLPPGVTLNSLKEGDTIGVLCKSCDRTLHFYISSTHLEIKLPDGDMRLPSSRYAVVDMYGQCCAVEFRGLEDDRMIMDDSDSVVRIQIEKEQLTHVKRHIKSRKTKNQEQQQQQAPIGEVPAIGQIPPDAALSEEDFQKQIEPEKMESGSIEDGEGGKTSAHGLTLSSQSLPSAQKQPCDGGACSYPDCPYFKRCRGFLERLSIPDVFLSPKLEHSKCYCGSCCQLRAEPDVKYSGDPPAKYAVPHGWVKFGLKLSFGPQADSHKSFDMWHKAYHGTIPGRVRSILDHGGLLLPGSSLLDGGAVTQPPGHYTDDWKPANHDPHRIFVSPSIKYCSFRDVYTKKHRFMADGKQYDGRVCLKVLIKPDSYSVSPKTIDSRGEVIDRNFEDSKLEWSTSVDRGIYLYGLVIRVDQVKPK